MVTVEPQWVPGPSFVATVCYNFSYLTPNFPWEATVATPRNPLVNVYVNADIVGVVISQLNKLKVEKAIRSLPENVNFGIKASTVRQFLTSAGLPTKWSNRTERKSTKELAQIAKNQTVMVVCNP